MEKKRRSDRQFARRPLGIELTLLNFFQPAIMRASLVLTWPRWLKQLVVSLADTVLILFSVWSAFALRLGEWNLFDWPAQRFALTMLVVWFPVALYQKIYHSIFRYSGRGTMVALTLAVSIASVPLILIYGLWTYPGVPRTIPILAPILFWVFAITARIIGRYILIDLFHSQPNHEKPRRVLIYGAGSTGQHLATSLSSEQGMRLIGFIDDDPAKMNQRLERAPIFSSDDLQSLITALGITDIILAITRVRFSRRREILQNLKSYPVNVQVLPTVRDVFDGRLMSDALRPVQIHDLLGRPPVAPDAALMETSVRDKVVMITGAGGSIGSELCRQALLTQPKALILVEATEYALFAIFEELSRALDISAVSERPLLFARLVNIADERAVKRLFEEFSPQTIYHAAAYKHVPLLEDNVLSGLQNNLLGTRNLLRAAENSGPERFIFISTDKAVRPPNVMGASKRLCEMILQDGARSKKPGDMIIAMVRFGNVLGSSGSVVPTFQRQIEAGGPVTVTHREVTRYFMTIREAAQLVIQAGSMADGGEVFLLDMGQPVKIWDLARSMIKLAGLTICEDGKEGDIKIVETGLRAGEKLHEELLIGSEARATSHPRIMKANETFPDTSTLHDVVLSIQRAIGSNDEDACRRALERVVPSLKAQARREATVNSLESTSRQILSESPRL